MTVLCDVLGSITLLSQLRSRAGGRLVPGDFNMLDLGICEEVVVNALSRCAPDPSDIVPEYPITSAGCLSEFENLAGSPVAQRIDDGALSVTREMREAERF